LTRKPDTIDPKLTSQLAGDYTTPIGGEIQIGLAPGAQPSAIVPDATIYDRRKDPSGEFMFPKK
jgi:hypothetical protein